MEDNSEEEKIYKIKSIVEKEIAKELVSKQNEVLEISEKIKIVLRNLELLKYVVTVSYYDENPVLTSKKGQEETSEDDKSQMQIHPCVKKLLPFHNAYEKSLGIGSHYYETRNSKKSEPSSNVKSIEKSKEGEEANNKNKNELKNNMKIPQYIPPLPNGNDVSNVNKTGRDASKEAFRVVVGNVSKWIPPDTREDSSTHKWMVYIRNKEDGRDMLKYLKKIRYFLHESYKPHDIIDVTAPFQLTRRGWGEFPIRVQLHFVNPLNKPIDIIHNLKLDMTCSGIQMLGGETVVEISLNVDDSANLFLKEVKMTESAVEDEKKEKQDCVETKWEKQDVFDDNLLMSISSEKTSESVKKEYPSCKSVIKEEFKNEELDSGKSCISHRLEDMKTAICNSRKFLLDRRKAMRIIGTEHDYLGPGQSSSDKSINDFARSILKLDFNRCDGNRKPLKNGIAFNLNHAKQKGDRLPHVNLSGSHQSEEEIFRRLKNAVKKDEAETQSRYSLKVFRHAYLVNVLQRAQASNLKSVESLIKWFVQRWPVITKLSMDPVYKMIHPYSCPTEAEFFRYSVGKQRSAEWFRAKAIQKVMKTLQSVIPIDEDIWTTKQILLWCRFHGYFPVSSSSSLSGSTSTSTTTPSSSCTSVVLVKSEPVGRSYDSSSESEDGLDKAMSLKTGTSQYLNGVGLNDKKKNFKKSRKKDFGEKGQVINYRECNTYTEAQCDSTRFGQNDFRNIQAEEHCVIDVVGIETVKEFPTKKVKSLDLRIKTVPQDQLVFNKFVCETARQMGVKIMEEEVIPGVSCDSVSRVLSKSVASFLDDLLRRSCARAWIRNGERCPETLEMNDILGTLIEHPQFDIFTNRGLGQQMPGTSNA